MGSITAVCSRCGATITLRGGRWRDLAGNVRCPKGGGVRHLPSGRPPGA